MTNEKCVLSFDLGASGGRAVLGTYDGSRIRMEELHRFTNDPVHLGRTMYWDVLRLFHEMKQGLLKARGHEIASIGTDTWGVDFGLLDSAGALIENPVHYRDRRTVGMAGEAFQKISRDTLYRITGNQIMEINTIFQLLALKQKRPELLARAKTLLLMPDLLNYFLSGEKKTEYSIATTTQMLDARSRTWSREGHEYSYGELEQLAAAAPAQRSFIRPDDPAFLPSGDMPLRIRAACERTGQPVPESVGAVIRCIDESLALSYRAALTEIETCTNTTTRSISSAAASRAASSPSSRQTRADAPSSRDPLRQPSSAISPSSSLQRERSGISPRRAHSSAPPLTSRPTSRRTATNGTHILKNGRG